MILQKIRRWWQGHGFGIESKTDFAFLHDVICEKRPYYAYDEWQQLFPEMGTKEQRTAALLLRICNNLQPSNVSIHGNAGELEICAIRRGCRKTVVNISDKPYVKLCHFNISTKLEKGFIMEFSPGKENNNSAAAVVLTHINNGNNGIWQQLISLPTITYDLGDTGIALLRDGRYPEHYCI